MKLTSSVFHHNQKIPRRYSGEGGDVSPPLEWSFVPEGCRAFALVCQDPDAPRRPGKEHPFVHWLIYGIGETITSLPEGLPQRGRLDLPVAAAQGKNSFGHLGYNGPLPPPGHGEHHYHFQLHALDKELVLEPGLARDELLHRIQGHVIRTAELTGTYERAGTERRSA